MAPSRRPIQGSDSPRERWSLMPEAFTKSAWPRLTTRPRGTGLATVGKRGLRGTPWLLSAPVSRSFACSPASAAHSHIAISTPRSNVVLRGSGRVKLDDELFDVGPLDSIRVAPATARAFEAGQDGLELLAFGPHHPGDGEPVEDPWTDRIETSVVDRWHGRQAAAACMEAKVASGQRAAVPGAAGGVPCGCEAIRDRSRCLQCLRGERLGRQGGRL